MDRLPYVFVGIAGFVVLCLCGAIAAIIGANFVDLEDNQVVVEIREALNSSADEATLDEVNAFDGYPGPEVTPTVRPAERNECIFSFDEGSIHLLDGETGVAMADGKLWYLACEGSEIIKEQIATADALADLPEAETSDLAPFVTAEELAEMGVVTSDSVEADINAALADPEVAQPLLEALVNRPYEAAANRCPGFGEAELQPISGDKFLVDGRSYDIAAFGAEDCWLLIEGRTLFHGWRETFEVHIAWGAQEQWPHREGTLRIYPDEGFQPVASYQKIFTGKCENWNEEEVGPLPLEVVFHGKERYPLTCDQVLAGEWPEIPEELLEPQKDDYPLCSGVPNGNPVCDGEEVPAIGFTTPMTDTLTGEVLPACPDNNTAVTMAEAQELPDGCPVLLDAGVNGVYLLFVADLEEGAIEHGHSIWAFPTTWDGSTLASEFVATICSRDEPAAVPVYRWDGTQYIEADEGVCD